MTTEKVSKVSGGTKPWRYTQKQIAKALVEAHGVQTKAAEILGCERITVRRYIKRFPSLQEVLNEAPERITDIAEGHLINGVIKGIPEDVRWWLKTKGRNRGYGDVSRQEVTGPGGGPMQLLTHEITAEEVKEIARRALNG